MDSDQMTKKVFVNGCFDVLHVGHVRLLHYARTLGDYLTVAINSDASVLNLKGPGRPINTAQDRLEVLMAIKYVSNVVIFSDPDPLNILKSYEPHVVVKGSDYYGRSFPELKWLQDHNVAIHYYGHTNHSTSKIIEQQTQKRVAPDCLCDTLTDDPAHHHIACPYRAWLEENR